MTDFRNYIYRLAEAVSDETPMTGENVDAAYRQSRRGLLTRPLYEPSLGAKAMLREPTKTPAGWRYDA